MEDAEMHERQFLDLVLGPPFLSENMGTQMMYKIGKM